MSSVGEEVKLSLKVMINKEKTKVLFAEVDSHFADLLFSILILPLGKIVNILANHYKDKSVAVGSITTLYRSISTNLDYTHLWNKCYLLDPTIYDAHFFKLKFSFGATQQTMKYPPREDTQSFLKRRKRKSTKASEAAAEASVDADNGVFALKSASFVISDDLRVAPVAPESILQTLKSVGVTDMDGAEQKAVTFGFSEIKDLLRGSLVSETPLTDIILNKSRIKRNCVAPDLLKNLAPSSSSTSKKISVKAIVQKSSNKLLIAQTREDFVECLCSLLVIPLGAIECILGGKTCLKNIDNLYRSVANINGDKYLKTKDTKNMLIKPKLGNYHLPRNHNLPLVEQGLIPSQGSSYQGYVKVPAMYSVTDDLTVTPFCFTSSVSVLSGLKVPLSDVKEMDLQIGVEEAMNILKASLTSTSALTDALINPLLKKQPKQELREPCQGVNIFARNSILAF